MPYYTYNSRKTLPDGCICLDYFDGVHARGILATGTEPPSVGHDDNLGYFDTASIAGGMPYGRFNNPTLEYRNYALPTGFSALTVEWIARYGGIYTWASSAFRLLADNGTSTSVLFMSSSGSGMMQGHTPTSGGWSWNSYGDGGGTPIDSGISENSWRHFALVYTTPSTVKLYINGAIVYTLTDVRMPTSVQFYSHVLDANSWNSMTGYYDVTQLAIWDHARYTSRFTVPTTPYIASCGYDGARAVSRHAPESKRFLYLTNCDTVSDDGKTLAALVGPDMVSTASMGAVVNDSTSLNGKCYNYNAYNGSVAGFCSGKITIDTDVTPVITLETRMKYTGIYAGSDSYLETGFQDLMKFELNNTMAGVRVELDMAESSGYTCHNGASYVSYVGALYVKLGVSYNSFVSLAAVFDIPNLKGYVYANGVLKVTYTLKQPASNIINTYARLNRETYPVYGSLDYLCMYSDSRTPGGDSFPVPTEKYAKPVAKCMYGRIVPRIPENLLVLYDGINKYGLEPSSGTLPTTTKFDTNGPLTSKIGTPYILNSSISRVCWTQLLPYHVSGNYSVEVWCKSTIEYGGVNTPLPMFYGSGDNLWCAGFSITNNSSAIAWTNDSSDSFSTDTTKWHHYAVSCDENRNVRYFLDGQLIVTRKCTSSSGYNYFALMEKWSSRGEVAYAQFAFWSTCKWTTNFTVVRKPIMRIG